MLKNKDVVISVVVMVAVILTGGMFSNMEQARGVSFYRDTRGHWAERDIVRLSDMGVLNGINGDFRPENTVTRAELATIMQRLMGFEPWGVSGALVNFSDLDSNAWFAQACLSAYRAGIMAGDYNGSFRPDDSVTREEAAVILVRSLGLDEVPAGEFFSDSEDIALWAVGSVNALANRGIMGGNYHGEFEPNRAMTRGEIAAIISRAFPGIYGVYGEYNGIYDGSVLARGAGVILNDSVISENLLISEGVGDGWVLIDRGVAINGKLIIRGGGNEYGVIIDQSTELDEVIINRIAGPLRVVFEGDLGTRVDSILVESDNVTLVGYFGEGAVRVGSAVRVAPRIIAHDAESDDEGQGNTGSSGESGGNSESGGSNRNSGSSGNGGTYAEVIPSNTLIHDSSGEDFGQEDAPDFQPLPTPTGVPVPDFSQVVRQSDTSNSPTVTPTPIPVPTRGASLSSSYSDNPTPTDVPGVTGTVTPTPTDVPGVTGAVTPTPTDVPGVTGTVTPTPTDVPDDIGTVTPVPTLTPTMPPEVAVPSAPVFDQHGNLVGALAGVIDFTEERLADEFYGSDILEWWVWEKGAWVLGIEDLLDPDVFAELVCDREVIVYIESEKTSGGFVIPARREAPEFNFPILRPILVGEWAMEVRNQPLGESFETRITVDDWLESRWEEFVFGSTINYCTEGEQPIITYSESLKIEVRHAATQEDFASEARWVEYRMNI